MQCIKYRCYMYAAAIGMHSKATCLVEVYLNSAWNEKFMQAYEQKWVSCRDDSPAFGRPTVFISIHLVAHEDQ